MILSAVTQLLGLLEDVLAGPGRMGPAGFLEFSVRSQVCRKLINCRNRDLDVTAAAAALVTVGA